MRNVMIVFGYNNTRLYDIERIKKYCNESFDAEILLCKDEILPQDNKITRYSLQANLEIRDYTMIEAQIKLIDNYLAENNLHPIACLPFSDKGIPLGSYYAKSRGLVHDDCERSLACIDKYHFRCLEKSTDTPEWYKKPFFTRIYTYEEAIDIVKKTNVPLFFKPTQEGNSRGCVEINSEADLLKNKEILDSYFQQGVIVEECIENCDEYSFDGVNGRYIITEKKTSSGFFRVETQHIVPAPLGDLYYQRLIEAGMIVAKISGSNNGAVHNELFLNKKTGEVYCVEPNRRPAGLKLWDWIRCAYPGVDNWGSWLSWASSRPNFSSLPIKNAYYVGCRMLTPKVTGIITHIDEYKKKILTERNNIIEIGISKIVGQAVTSNLKDNSDFIGYVVCQSETLSGLHNLLDDVANEASILFTIDKANHEIEKY